MRTITLVVALLGLSAPALAQDRTGFVNLQRAVDETADGKKATAELQAELDARNKAVAEAEAAKKKDPKAKPPALPTNEQFADQWHEHQRQKTAPILARLERIFPTILKARKLTAIGHVQTMVYVPPALDVTDELVRRYDAGEGAAPVADAKALRDENAALKAKVAALEKRKPPHAPPSAPPESPAIPNLDPRAMTSTRTPH